MIIEIKFLGYRSDSYGRAFYDYRIERRDGTIILKPKKSKYIKEGKNFIDAVEPSPIGISVVGKISRKHSEQVIILGFLKEGATFRNSDIELINVDVKKYIILDRDGFAEWSEILHRANIKPDILWISVPLYWLYINSTEVRNIIPLRKVLESLPKYTIEELETIIKEAKKQLEIKKSPRMITIGD